MIENGYLKKQQMVYINCLCLKKPQDMENEKEKDIRKNIENGEKVLERDKYICQMCGRPKSNIAHHKIRFRDCYDNENIAHDVSNGICLCKRCHKMVHGGGNYTNG